MATLAALDPRKLEDKSASESRHQPSPLREFFWDGVVLFATFGIIGLSAVNTVFQFVQDNKLACKVTDSAAASAGASTAYIDNYCYGDLPYIQYIPVFNVVIGTLIAAPHFLWLNLAAKKFALFFTLATTLNLVPNPNTGTWNPVNNVIVQRVESVYDRDEYSILIGYFLKLITQMFLSVIGLFVVIVVFAGGSVNFYCPKKFSNSTIPDFWPLNHPVECTYGTLQQLMFLRWIDVMFLGVIIIALILGFINGLFPRQSMEYLRGVAKFRLQSTLPSKYGSFTLRPMIKTDLDFLMSQLLRGGGDMAYCFLEIQEYFRRKEMDYKEMARVSFLREEDTPNTLTPENLSNELLAVSNWHQLLTNLGVQPREEGYDRHRTEDLSVWLQTPNASWLDVVRALQQMGDRGVAESIRHKYIVPDLQLCFPLTGGRYLTSYLPHLGGNSLTAMAPTPEELSKAKEYLATPLDPYHRTEHGWLHLEPDVRGAVLSFAAFCPRRDVAVFLKYGSSGKFVPYTLARAFREVILMNFNYKYRDPVSRVPKFLFPRVHITTVTFHPWDALQRSKKEFKETMREIWESNAPSQDVPPDKTDDATVDNDSEFLLQTESPTQEAPPPGPLGQAGESPPPTPLKADFIVVCPIEEEFDKSATTIFLEDLHSNGHLSDEALLLSIYPLKVGGSDVRKRFWEYIPPSCQQQEPSFQFQAQECQHQFTATNSDEWSCSCTDFKPVPGTNPDCTHTLPLKCGNIHCQFRFSLYKRETH